MRQNGVCQRNQTTVAEGYEKDEDFSPNAVAPQKSCFCWYSGVSHWTLSSSQYVRVRACKMLNLKGCG